MIHSAWPGNANGAMVVLSVALMVMADLATTFATFMPMKSLLILGLGEVPSFFPGFLISGGPTLASSFLLAVSAVLAYLGFWIRNLIGEAGRLKISGILRIASNRFGKNKGSARPWELGELSNLVLITFLLLGVFVVSLPLFLTISTWLILTLSTIFFFTVHGEIRPPYLTVRAFFQGRARQWLTVSSLWSTVAFALFVLLLYPPTFGLAAVLLGAVLVMRLQRAVAQLGHRVIPVWASPKLSNDDRINRYLVSETSSAPLDFFGSVNGYPLLAQEIAKQGLADAKFTRVGIPNRSQMSLLVNQSWPVNSSLLRIFAPDKLHKLEKEERFLAEFSGDLLPAGSVTRIGIAGFHGLLVTWPSVFQLRESFPALNTVVSWQIKWDRACLDTLSDRQLFGQSDIPDPQEFLLPLLVSLRRFNGSHNEITEELIKSFTVLRKIFLDGPLVFSFQDNIRPANFLQFDDGTIRPIDFSEVKSNVLGASWLPLEAIEKRWGDLSPEEKPFDEMEFGKARIRSQIIEASRHARVGNFPQFESSGKAILRGLSRGSSTL